SVGQSLLPRAKPSVPPAQSARSRDPRSSGACAGCISDRRTNRRRRRFLAGGGKGAEKRVDDAGENAGKGRSAFGGGPGEARFDYEESGQQDPKPGAEGCPAVSRATGSADQSGGVGSARSG